MQMTKIKIGALVLLAASTIGAAMWAGGHRSAAADPRNPAMVPASPSNEQPAAGRPERQWQAMIHICVLEGDPLGSRDAGTLKVLAEPRLVALEGQTFSFLSGGEQVVPDGAHKVQFLDFGLSIRGTAKPGKEAGTVFLDVRMDNSTIPDQSGDVLRLNSEGTRMLGTFKLGKVVMLRLPKASGERQTWAELVVENVK
jgi:hypothetical protein